MLHAIRAAGARMPVKAPGRRWRAALGIGLGLPRMLRPLARLGARRPDPAQEPAAAGDLADAGEIGLFRTSLDGRYLGVSLGLARIYGYSSRSELMAAVTDIAAQLYVDPGRRRAFAELMRRNGVICGFESEIRRRDGSTIWIAETCREVRDQHGRPLYYEGTVEDVTARRRAERRAGERDLEASVARLHFYTRLLAREVVPAAEPVPLAALAATALAAVDPRGERPVACVGLEGVRLRTDPDLLARALSELLHNAFRHSAPEGRVTLRLSREGGAAVLRVIDCGRGLAPEAAGKGIGLAVAGEALRLLGGTVAVATDRWSGLTTATVTLPEALLGGSAA
ncbi:MAG TPA: ATP-binding protein [Azospirillaceae bacterium]|nr:ATP-binding protein [Azospirillaceae bacterium]